MSDNTFELLDLFDSDVKTYDTAAVRKQRKSKSIYGDQLICLAALMGMSIWQSGLRALVICLGSVLVCVLSDLVFCRMTGKTYNPKDLSTIAAGMCIALMMPASVHYGTVAGGALLAIAVKHIFGGKVFVEGYIWQRLILHAEYELLSFPANYAFATDPLFVGVNERPAAHGILLGPGYKQDLGTNLSLYTVFLFSVYDPQNVRGIMDIRVGVNYKF